MAYEWEYLSVDPLDSPGSETFFIDHKSSFVDRYGSDLDRKHSNGIDHISAITLFVSNVNKSCEQWSKILGMIFFLKQMNNELMLLKKTKA